MAGTWDETHTLLVEYVAERLTLPREGDRYRRACLGFWVRAQKRLRREGRLEERRARLLAALPGWTWDIDYWHIDEHRALLDEYVREHGSVPSPMTCWRCADVGTWAAAQGLDSAADPSWEEMYALAGERCRIKRPLMPNEHFRGRALGDWAAQQQYEHLQGALSRERAARLAALPHWGWRRKTNQRWLNAYSAAARGVVDPYICAWMNRQRAAMENDRLCSWRRRLLLELPAVPAGSAAPSPPAGSAAPSAAPSPPDSGSAPPSPPSGSAPASP